MLGILFSVLAGVCMSLQGVLNTRTSEKIGLTETNIIVQLSGLALTILIFIFFSKGNLKKLETINRVYLLGGVLGVVIIYAVMIGIEKMGTTFAISTILIAQLASAAIIDAFALFGAKYAPFSLTKIIGVIVMIAGIIIFKWKW